MYRKVLLSVLFPLCLNWGFLGEIQKIFIPEDVHSKERNKLLGWMLEDLYANNRLNKDTLLKMKEKGLIEDRYSDEVIFWVVFGTDGFLYRLLYSAKSNSLRTFLIENKDSEEFKKRMDDLLKESANVVYITVMIMRFYEDGVLTKENFDLLKEYGVISKATGFDERLALLVTIDKLLLEKNLSEQINTLKDILNVFDSVGGLGDLKCRIANNHIRSEDGTIDNFDEEAEYCLETVNGSIATYFTKNAYKLIPEVFKFFEVKFY